jgi:hypothetical protein
MVHSLQPGALFQYTWMTDQASCNYWLKGLMTDCHTTDLIKSILIVDECQNVQFTCQTCHKNKQCLEDKCRVNFQMPYVLNIH